METKYQLMESIVFKQKWFYTLLLRFIKALMLKKMFTGVLSVIEACENIQPNIISPLLQYNNHIQKIKYLSPQRTCSVILSHDTVLMSIH